MVTILSPKKPCVPPKLHESNRKHEKDAYSEGMALLNIRDSNAWRNFALFLLLIGHGGLTRAMESVEGACAVLGSDKEPAQRRSEAAACLQRMGEEEGQGDELIRAGALQACWRAVEERPSHDEEAFKRARSLLTSLLSSLLTSLAHAGRWEEALPVALKAASGLRTSAIAAKADCHLVALGAACSGATLGREAGHLLALLVRLPVGLAVSCACICMYVCVCGCNSQSAGSELGREKVQGSGDGVDSELMRRGAWKQGATVMTARAKEAMDGAERGRNELIAAFASTGERVPGGLAGALESVHDSSEPMKGVCEELVPLSDPREALRGQKMAVVCEKVHRGEPIGAYSGWLAAGEEMDEIVPAIERVEMDKYTVEVLGWVVRGGGRLCAEPGLGKRWGIETPLRAANEPVQGHEASAALVVMSWRPYVAVVAVREMEAGEEVTVEYGQGYWLAEEGKEAMKIAASSPG